MKDASTIPVPASLRRKVRNSGFSKFIAKLFADNEAAKQRDRLTDLQIKERLVDKFGKNPQWEDVANLRGAYNRGMLTNGKKPKAKSRRYWFDGTVMEKFNRYPVSVSAYDPTNKEQRKYAQAHAASARRAAAVSGKKPSRPVLGNATRQESGRGKVGGKQAAGKRAAGGAAHGAPKLAGGTAAGGADKPRVTAKRKPAPAAAA